MRAGQVLMCAPTYLSTLSPERCWTVDETEPLDPARALDQWHLLRALVAKHIAPVVEAQAQPWASAMTFTRDVGLYVDGTVVALAPHLRRGAFETPLAARVFRDLAVDAVSLDHPLGIDGGNVLADSHGRLLIGAVTDDDDELTASAKRLEELTGRAAHRVPIGGGLFPHIDMAMADLGGRAWLVYPNALPGYSPDEPAWRDLFCGRPVIHASVPDGSMLASNLIMGDDVVIGSAMSDELARAIEAVGFQVMRTPLGEFAKAGGGAHCLTLELPPEHPKVG